MSSKGTGVLLAVLCGLLAVQTWRLHNVRQSVEPSNLSDRHSGPGTQPFDSNQDSPIDRSGPGVSAPDAIDRTAKTSLFHPAPDEPKDALTALKELAENDGPDASGDSIASEDATIENRGRKGRHGSPKRGNGSSDGDKKASPQAEESDKNLVRNGIARARAAARSGDYDKAVELLSDLIDSTKDNGQAYQALARMYRDLGMPDDALALYQEWSAAQPDSAQAHLGMANTYEALGLNAEALAELQAYENLSGGSADSYSELAAMYRRLGMTGEEGQSLNAWLDAAPSSPQAMRAMADYYRRNGDYGNAVSQYQSVLTAEPGNVSARLNLAQTYQQMGQYTAAQSEYLAALELTPGDANIWLRLGESYRRTGDVASAINSYQNVISLEPGSTAAFRATRQINRLQQQAAPKLS